MSNSSREYEKFYKKIRRHIEQFETDSGQPTSSPNSSSGYSGVPIDRLYGNVTQEEFEKILETYDSQRSNPSTQDKPVKSDGVTGGSYETLLFSKPGFHHLGSTAYLVRDIGINDVSRNSFLGGHSTFSVTAEEDVKGLNKNQDRIKLRRALQKITELLDIKSIDAAKAELDKIRDIEPNNADFLAIRGKYHATASQHDDAVRILKRSLEFGPSDPLQVSLFLSDVLYNIGLKNFFRQQLEVAQKYFDECLLYNRDHPAAKMHRDMCISNLQKTSRFSGPPKPAYRK